MFNDWSRVLETSFQNLGKGMIEFIPHIVMAIVILIFGWVIGAVLGRVISQIIHALKLDRALESAGVADLLDKAGVRLNSGEFIGGLVKWFFIVAFLVASFEVLGLEQVNDFLDIILGYLPQVIVAALVLLISAVIADAVQKIVVGSAKAADMEHAYFLGGVARWAIWGFAIIVALTHLGIGPMYMEILFTGFIAMISLAGGLAFGLGGKDAAAHFLEKLRGDITK